MPHRKGCSICSKMSFSNSVSCRALLFCRILSFLMALIAYSFLLSCYLFALFSRVARYTLPNAPCPIYINRSKSSSVTFSSCLVLANIILECRDISVFIFCCCIWDFSSGFCLDACLLFDTGRRVVRFGKTISLSSDFVSSVKSIALI